jgi:signal transduction histidine kinase
MRTNRSPYIRILWLALVALAYFAAARACIDLPTREGELTAIWLPSGVAVAAVLLGGPWMLVGVFAGDVAVSLVSGFDLSVAAWFAAGDTAEAAIAALVIDRIVPHGAFRRPREVFLILPAIALGCAVSATNGTLVLLQQDLLEPAGWGEAWLLYWSSTATGIVLIAPAILAWRREDEIARSFLRSTRRPRVLGEVVLLTVLLALVCTQVFLRADWELLGLFLIFPLFTWATVRFGQYGATLSVLVVAGFGVWGTAHESLDFAGMTHADIVQVLQLLLAVVLLANLVLAVVLAERDRARGNVEELLSVFGTTLHLANVGSWQLRLRPRAPEVAELLVDGTAAIDTELGGSEQRTPDGVVPAASLAEVAEALGPAHADELAVRLWYSPELSSILGLADDENHHHRPLAEMLALVLPEDRPRLLKAVRTAIVHGGVYSIEHGIRRQRDGARRVLRHIGTIVDREDPHGARLVGSVLDITDQREVDLLKDSLVATASHELRTPLTSVLGFASTLGRSWDQIPDGERRRYLDIIESQARRLVDIVDDTLEQARLDNRSISVTAVPIDARAAIESMLRTMTDVADVTIRGDAGNVCIADLQHLDRILVNLLSNARKYGQPPIIISCETVIDADHPRGAVAIRVIDHGAGIAPSFRPRMFDRFTRGPDTVHADGTGLGLSIVHGLAEAMDGEIRYRREAGTTVFEVLLPSAAATEIEASER